MFIGKLFVVDSAVIQLYMHVCAYMFVSYYVFSDEMFILFIIPLLMC